MLALCFLVGCGRHGFDALDAQGSALDDGAATDGTSTLVTYRDAVLADQPIAYWRLGEIGGLGRDEKFAHPANFAGTCVPVPGALAADDDTALHFDGLTCYALIPNGLEFPGNAPFTIEVWIREERADIYQIYFMKQTRLGANPDDGYAILIDASGQVYVERYVSASGQATLPTSLSLNQWVHLVATYDGAVLLIYFDGEQVASQPAPETMPAVPMSASIGAIADSSTKFQGDMDELAIYDYALSAQRIKTHRDIGVAGPINGN